MIEFRIDYSEATDGPFLGVLDSELIGWAEEMDREGKLQDAIEELRSERAAYVQKIEELDGLIRALESRTANRDGSVTQTVVLHSAEFSNASIAEAAVTMIRRANRALHVRDIMNGLQAGGYKFKAQKPMDSVAPVLYLAAKKKKHGLVNKGGNTYSLKEIEERSSR